MRVVTTGNQASHRPPFELEAGYQVPPQDCPERVSAILQEIQQREGIVLQTPDSLEVTSLHDIHDSEYVRFLQQTCSSLGERAIIPSVFPRKIDPRTTSDLVRLGQYAFDTYTPLTKGAFDAAWCQVRAACTAARLVQSGERVAYALGRPPGHHAERARFGGYSYLNATAMAANWLAQHGPVAILDVDVHHGNGTQDIFYARSDVCTASIHGDPAGLFPYFSGFRDETGIGSGLGGNRNFPLPPATNDRGYQPVLETALDWLSKSRPAFLVVALGFDTHEADPIGGFRLSTAYFTQMAATIRQLNLPMVLVQEGGYSLENLGACANALLEGLTS